ncbi:M48 family metallopeptidase [Nitrobacter sp.]|uniref:M48 family metallopeptidase n=1 Tax=Nitrobacter sp. TaxID=29420 RepID=UPI001D32DC91|nr:M48 family metallopeptidase [Nitrobacter sp.]MCB1392769.1 M48 family metallopeptidase [Nitrobacter sp.]MCV0385644.1 M48 family metallopeptidase [Nitrobacter sp.]
MAAYGLYTHIASNRIRSMFLLAGLFVLIYVMVFAGALIAEVFRRGMDYPAAFYITNAWHDLIAALPWATAGSALWIVVAYFFHQSIIDAVTGGHDVTRKEQPQLYNLLENLCISRGIPMPKLKVIDTNAINAFATGLNRRQYAITVTTGLMNQLNDREMEAVLGHELTHIRNGDVQLMVVAVIIAGVVGFVAELFFRIFLNNGARIGSRGWRSSRSSSSRDGNGKGGGGVIAVILAIVLIALAWFLSQVVRMALSRSRELMADAGSVELTKNPDAMISALRKIENRGELPGATSAVMEMCVDNPRQGFVDLFATHPSIETRVRALVTYAGGHDPGPMQLHTEHAATDPKLPELPPGPWSEPAPKGTATPIPGPPSPHS